MCSERGVSFLVQCAVCGAYVPVGEARLYLGAYYCTSLHRHEGVWRQQNEVERLADQTAEKS